MCELDGPGTCQPTEVPEPFQFEINIQTTNPDFLARLKEAVDNVGLDLDLTGKPWDLDLHVYSINDQGQPSAEPVYGTVFEPDEEGI